MKILLIEDDKQIVDAISIALEIRWPECEVIYTHLGEKGIDMVESEKPDGVILDLGLPDTNGFEVLKRIRLFSHVPVLILTVRSEEAEIVKGLELGADDYVTKPFRNLELLARIKALTRRHGNLESSVPVNYGKLSLDPTNFHLKQGLNDIELTRTEGTILLQLINNAGRIITYGQLSQTLWGEDYPEAENSIKVYIRRLREKLEENPGEPKLIINKPGIGYQLSNLE